MAELEQFCLLAKTQKGRACAALVQQVLNHKKIFNFSELLEISSVQALRGTEFDNSFNSLELFAFGTVGDYFEQQSKFIQLSDLQLLKLKTLTLMTLCGINKHLKYDELLVKLHLNSIRELEDLIIETLYAGLLSGKLDQANQVFRVGSVSSRDVRVETLNSMLASFRLWKTKCEMIQKALVTSNGIIHDSRAISEAEQNDVQKSADETKKKIKEVLDSGVEISELEGFLTGKGSKSSKVNLSQFNPGRPFGKGYSRGRL